MDTTRKKHPAAVCAAVETIHGVPRLVIDGCVTSGNMVFLNGDTLDMSADIYDSEIAHIAAAGEHLYSTITNLSFAPGSSPAADGLRCLDSITDNDPAARIMLRVKTSQGRDPGVREEELFTLPDGRALSFVSLACDRWFEQALHRMAALVREIQQSEAYARHVFAYHLEWNEWMQPHFTTGPDVSESNSCKFREWLAAKYQNDTALQQAWNGSETLADARVPDDLPIGVSERALLLVARDQRYIDYLDYIGELTASRIEALARLIKEETAGENVVMSFYGYYFEIYHATSGHFAFRRLLESPWLDGFAGPTTYMDRHGEKKSVTATSGYMTVVDSVARAGKLWIMESDQRTFINHTEKPNDCGYSILQSLNEIYTVHQREVGIAMVHGAALYPMDLMGLGWYDDASIWSRFGILDRACLAYKNAQAERPMFDVALVVDEKAQSAVGCSMLSNRMLAQMMLAMYRTGVRFALVEIGDVLSGRADDCRMYLFVNPFRLSTETADGLCGRLHRQGKTAVFLYGFGRTAAEDVRKLTGMEIVLEETMADHVVAMDAAEVPGVVDEEPLNTLGVSRVLSGGTGVFGRYADGSTAAAVHEEAGWRTIFCGSAGLTAANIRALAAWCGIPVLCDSGDVLVANQDLAVLSTSTAGDKTVRFDSVTDVYDYYADTWYERVREVHFPGLAAGQCKWLFYGDRNAIRAMGLPAWRER